MFRKYAVRGAAVLAFVAGGLAAPGSAGAANSVVSLPSPVTVGQTGLPASFTIGGGWTVCGTNGGGGGVQGVCQNGGPRVYPACADGDGYFCDTPDAGVFSLSPTGTGRAGSACAGAVFTIGPYGTGGFVFSPPGGADFPVAGGTSCVIDFTVDVLKTPVTDRDPGTPGTQTQTFGGFTEYAGCCGGIRMGQVDTTTVLAGTSSVTAAGAGATLAQPITATGTVTGSTPVTGENLTFDVYGPGDTTCSTSLATLTAATPVGAGGTATSKGFVPTAVGTYRWIAHYPGNAGNPAADSVCGAPGSTSVVSKARPTITGSASGGAGAFTDTATVSGRGGTTPGTVTFRLYGPNDPGCTGTPAFVSASRPVDAAGRATSAPFSPTAPGSYQWVATLDEDAGNAGVSTPCAAPTQSVALVATPQGNPPPTTCRSSRKLAVTITLAAPRGTRLTRTVVRINGKVKRTLGRGVTRFTLSLDGYPAGVARVILSATTTKGKRFVGTRTYRLCGYAAKPPTRFTPLHAVRG